MSSPISTQRKQWAGTSQVATDADDRPVYLWEYRKHPRLRPLVGLARVPKAVEHVAALEDQESSSVR